MRVNPEFSTQETAIYDPCAPGSRFGVTKANFREDLLDGIEGLHMHTLCEQGADALAATVEVFEQKFGEYLRGMRWLNLGGGHHITKPGYDIALLERTIGRLSDKYGVQVYLEPGEAIALNAGLLATKVLEIVENGIQTAISFDEQLSEGDILYFEDMAIYSMVKNNTFNGMPLPAIAAMRGGECSIVKEFGYADFKSRLS